MLETVFDAILKGPFRPKRSPAFLHCIGKIRQALHTQIGVIKSGKGMAGQILAGCRGTYCNQPGAELSVCCLQLASERRINGMSDNRLLKIRKKTIPAFLVISPQS